MNTKGKIIGGAIIIIVLVLVVVIFKNKKSPAPTETPSTNSNPTSSPASSQVTPEISFVDNTPREVLFKSNVPLKGASLENIRVFTKSASVTGAGEEDDFPNNYFKVVYDKKDQTITITDISGEMGTGFGAFNTGCAACTHEVEFINLETADGRVVPRVQISVY
jgi:hypothetical protein